MYIIALIILAIFTTWGWIARKEHISPNTGLFIRPFMKMSLFLYKKICIYRLGILKGSSVKDDIEKLYPGGNTAALITDFYVKKLSFVLMILLAGTALGTIVRFQAGLGHELTEEGAVYRGDYTQGDKRLTLSAHIEEGAAGQIELNLSAVMLEWEEAEKLEDEFWHRVCETLPGDNVSLEHVTEGLNCVEELEGYPFKVEWISSRPELLRVNGDLAELPEEPQRVMLTGKIIYGGCEEWEWNHDLIVTVCPPDRTEEEELLWELKQEIARREEAGRDKAILELPLDVQGRKIIWEEYNEDNSLIIWGLASVTAILIFVMSDRDLHKKLESKNIRMKQEYPLIINKMVLYLGAGMTMRGAFEKIAQDYQAGLEEGKKQNPAYEEMLYTCHEIKTGISEGAAYEHFGSRSGLQEYVRLSTLLSQNLKKGNSALLPRLREEAKRTLNEQTNRNREMGEEAGTKLLVPMIMMLGIVMVLIMIPAFSSFGI